MMKAVKSIILIIVFLAAPLWSQQIEFLVPDKIDVGKINEGDDIQGSIRFVNVGASPVTIKNIRTSCGCTAVKPDKETFVSGDTAKIDYTIKTAGFKGNISKSIRIDFEGGEIPSASFTIRAYVAKDINLTPSFLQFMQVSLDGDTTLTDFFEIQNDSDTPIEIKRIRVYNDLIEISPKRVVIPPHKSHLFQVKFTPRKEGRQDTRISIETNYTKEPILHLPVFIHVRS